MTGLVICTALRIEARAVRRGLPPSARNVRVVRTGLGLRRAARTAGRLPEYDALAVTGFGGALDVGLRPGDVLVATEVRFGERVFPCSSAARIAEELALAGLHTRTGPLFTSPRLVTGVERVRLAAAGVRAVDMETGPLAEVATGTPFAAVRVIVDTPAVPLLRVGTVRRVLLARSRLRRVAPVLVEWARVAGPRPGTRAQDQRRKRAGSTPPEVEP
ncbi:lipoprotein [Actinoallomurus vinaceus]|uniref:Lipoprotein n=1 Tax=Actinoallomurus vinaceus TaxID=1080074 RepID=A0ABP8U5P4_9ACTN